MAIRTQTELMIRRVQFIRRTKEAATQAACAGNSRGYMGTHGSITGKTMTRIICFDHITTATTCVYSSSEPVTDEEDEL